MNLPNILSVSRILLLIPIIIFFENDMYVFCIATFIFASFTDFLDGYFARKNTQTSDVGSILDLLADKIFVCTLLIWMTFKFNSSVILISSILIVTREISISYLRLFFVLKSKKISEFKSDLLGKVKTTFQMIGLGFILVSPLISDPIFNISLALLLLSSLISWFSFIQYLNKWIV
tara:strand:+ start:97 stop:624 length:528 start_codon:yes stop_codon:yes gene_type:complete